MDYRRSLEDLSLRGNEVQGIQLGLGRIRTVLRDLGDPQDRYRILHIAGTNGKGSVAAMSESMLRHAGIRTGLYTSPHLVRVEERIQVDGQPVSPRRFASLLARVFRAESGLLALGRIDIPMTYFELITACAFLHFAETGVSVAVVEVGLGGRLDATNIVRPDVCVITGISLDHQQWLGHTIPKIAAEKAGIVKPGIPVVSGCTSAAARSVIRSRAARMGAPLSEIDRDCAIRFEASRNGRVTLDLRTPSRFYRRLRPGLKGAHQVRNSALAVRALELMPAPRLRVGAVRRGLQAVRWCGRMEEIRSVRRTLLDGAHNPEAARQLRDYVLLRAFPEVHLVFGVMKDKDVVRMASILFPMARSVHLAPPDNPRAMQPTDLRSMVSSHRRSIRLHENPAAALRSAWAECTPGGWVIVTGSLYLVGEVLPLVRAGAAPTRGSAENPPR